MFSAKEWQAGGAFVAIEGHRIFVRSQGQGPALLLIHGFPTSSWDWARLWPELCRIHRVIAFDLLGFGLSDKPAGWPYPISGQADLAEAVLRHFQVEEYRLLAHDYGDTVAQELLARQLAGAAGPRLLGAALLNGGLFPESHRPLLLQRLLLSPLGPLLARLSSYRMFAANLRRICVAPWAEDELREHWRLLRHNEGLRVLPRLIGYMRQRYEMRERWVGALQQARVPVRVIAGADDPISGAHMLQRCRELVPQVDTVELPGTGHYPQVEAPQAVLAAVLSFFAQAR